MAKSKKANKQVKTKRKTSRPDKKKTNKKSEFDEYYHEEVEDFEEPEEDDIYEEVEDNREFMKQVKEFEKQHEGSKIVNVYNIIGKPAFKKCDELDNDFLEKEYKKILSLLDNQNIIVHFQSDYPLSEKYRFITEEIFAQDVENVEDTSLHINFIYEDFHPEMYEDDEEEF
jgi:hypothetical protein